MSLKFKLILLFSKGIEMNGIDITPFYDTIIFSDIADIINEFENNIVSILFTLILNLKFFQTQFHIQPINFKHSLYYNK